MLQNEPSGRDKFCILHFAFLIALLPACGHVMHPKADAYLEQAKGGDGLETLLNLTAMMQHTLSGTVSSQSVQADLDTLHDQFHALKNGFCLVSETRRAHPSFVQAVTIRKEMKTVFHRLWKFREDPALRRAHLDLFGKRVHELRDALERVKA